MFLRPCHDFGSSSLSSSSSCCSLSRRLYNWSVDLRNILREEYLSERVPKFSSSYSSWVATELGWLGSELRLRVFFWLPWLRGSWETELLKAAGVGPVSPMALSHAGPSLPPALLALRRSRCCRMDSPRGRGLEKSRASLTRSISGFYLQDLA